MIEKEMEKFFNEKLNNYKKAVYEELINMFGSECELFIRQALEVPVVYRVDKVALEFYDEITDSLDAEEQSVVDYFKEKLVESDPYIIGSSIRNVTDLMKKYASSVYHLEGKEEFISCNCIYNPFLIYSSDESYIQVLIYKIGSSLKVGDMKFIINEDIRWALSVEIVKRLHSKGFYLFDSKSLLEEYEFTQKAYFDKAKEEKDYEYDKFFLSPILEVLPLYFTNRNEFYRIVGEMNYTLLADSIARRNIEAIYDIINRMKESMERNTISEIVIVDINTITNALKSMREKQQTQNLETTLKKEEFPTIKPQRLIMPRSGRNIRLIEGLDLHPNISKINDINFKIDNINSILPIIDKFGEEILYIDEDGNDTLDPPSGRKM